jgi:phage FluMu gp28-like protein
MQRNEKRLLLIRKLIPTIYPYQEKIITSTSKELIINKSRQIGISYIVASFALTKAIFEEKTELIVSPSLRQSTHLMNYIYGHLGKLKTMFPDIKTKIENQTSIIFSNGGEIHSLPNSAETIRGYPADDIYIDEFAHFTCGTDKQIIEALAPSTIRGGNLWYISTPFGNQNLFYAYWNRSNIDKLLINWRECPDFTPESIEKQKQIFGVDGFNQEFENQFLSDTEGQEFPYQLITSCIDHELEYITDLDKNREYMGGADIGRKQDLTAIAVWEKQDNRYILRHKKILQDVPYNEQLNTINYLLNNYRFSKFFIDESGIGNMLAEEVYRKHPITRVTFNNENKQEMVGNFKRLMQENKIQYPNDPLIVDNIRAIKRVYTPSNYLKFESDHDTQIGHADLFWGMALGLYGESNKRQFTPGASYDWDT